MYGWIVGGGLMCHGRACQPRGLPEPLPNTLYGPLVLGGAMWEKLPGSNKFGKHWV